jgi:predicted nucleotidyltransferase
MPRPLDFSCRLIIISHELMIAKKDRDTITEIAREYRVGEVVLFGSSIAEGREPHDIDLGVKGIEPRLFFRFYGELMMRLSKPVDVVDLSQRTLFTELVEETGLTIYG